MTQFEGTLFSTSPRGKGRLRRSRVRVIFTSPCGRGRMRSIRVRGAWDVEPILLAIERLTLPSPGRYAATLSRRERVTYHHDETVVKR